MVNLTFSLPPSLNISNWAQRTWSTACSPKFAPSTSPPVSAAALFRWRRDAARVPGTRESMASENGTAPRDGAARLGAGSQANELAKVSSDYESLIQVTPSAANCIARIQRQSRYGSTDLATLRHIGVTAAGHDALSEEDCRAGMARSLHGPPRQLLQYQQKWLDVRDTGPKLSRQ